MGFLALVQERAKHIKKNGPRLFYELKPDKYGNFASYALRRFRDDFMPAEIDLGDRQVFYSLRHNVRDALRRANAPDETFRAITGWAPHDKAADFHASGWRRSPILASTSRSSIERERHHD